jgi:serine protease Do
LAQGSGFIISEDGYVVTNNHVVDNAAEVELVLDDGKSYDAKIIGTDKKTDLALLKIDADRTFPYVAFTGKDIEIGDWVLAVGNPFGLGGSVTVGVVSARGRDIGAGLYDDFIQIDAPINKGNSGGPTFNLDGEVVGINTAIFSPSGGSVGIGFAIPAGVAKDVIDQLRESGSVTRGWLGVQIQPVTRDIADSLGLKEATGALVADVQDNSPAKAAGMKVGDIILQVDNRSIADAKDLARKIGARNPDERANIKILREGKEQTVSVKLGRQKEEQVASLDAQPPQETAIDKLGLSLRAASDVPDAGSEGVVVTDVLDGSEAAEKGLEAGDVILQVDNRSVNSPDDVAKIIAEVTKAERSKVLFFVRSEQGQRFIPLELGKS